jgi:acyl carrier protein
MNRGESAAAVQEFIVKELVRDDIDLDVDEPLFSSGILDSFAAAPLICFLEERFGVRISAAEASLEKLDTISRTLDLVEQLTGKNPAS